MEDVKSKIRSVVESYERVFKKEFADFLTAQRPKQNEITTGDNKFGEMKAGIGVVERVLGEIPETLFNLFPRYLTSDEYTWLQSAKGQKWFYKEFKQYRLTKAI